MNEFVASNGVAVVQAGAGLYVKGDAVHLDRLREKLQAGLYGDVTPSMQVALREFFQHERDEELGRWRWPKNPNVVVYLDGEASRRSVTIVFEETGGVVIGMQEKFLATAPDEFHESRAAARAYFEAHPERKPWEDAKPGDVWLLTIDGIESAYYPSKSLDRAFTPVAPNTGTTAVPMDWPEITTGRRIWTKEAS